MFVFQVILLTESNYVNVKNMSVLPLKCSFVHITLYVWYLD